VVVLNSRRSAPALVALAAAAAAPSSAFAVDYLSAEQAARLIFPEADRFESADLTLDAAQMRRLEQQAGVKARSARWPLQAARKGAATLGWVVVDHVIGKFELIDYAVGLAADGTVRQVEILSYRESHGGEIRLPAWRRQFAGKHSADAIELGRDISNISGATLSCRHVTEGVRRIVRLMALLREDGLLR
jgi:Na+-translocating ferredoxin:NAD+ oxidoreductase RnfG subunit